MSAGKSAVYKLPFAFTIFLVAFICSSNRIVSIGSLASTNDPLSQKIDNPDSVVLFPIYNAQGVGYMDKTGRIVIPTQFHNAKRFSEGLARVEIDGKWGFIDKTGAVVIKPQFELVSVANDEDSSLDLDFHEGMAVVGRAEGPWRLTQKWGYIDRTGRITIPIQYDSAGRFSDGLAAIGERFTEKKGNFITEGGRSLGYLDKTGKIALKPGMDSGTFTEGLALAEINPFSDDSKKGYIDKTGKFVIQPREWEAYDFSERFARVRKATTDEWGFIDKTGKIVISMVYDDAKDFAEGFAAIKKNNLWGFIDKTGAIKINPRYLAVGNFSEGGGVCLC